VDKTQLWIAVCVYVLAASIKKETALEISLYTFLQIYLFFRENPTGTSFSKSKAIIHSHHQLTN